MVVRIATLIGLSLAFVGGTLAIAHRLTLAQAPVPPAAIESGPATPPAPDATKPAAEAQPAPAPAAGTPAPLPAPAAAIPTPAATAQPAPAPVAADKARRPETPATDVPPPATAAPAAASPPEPATVATPLPLPRPAIPPAAEASIPAKTLFSAVKLPNGGKAMAIGYYPRGCLSGGVDLPIDGPTWQVMRTSRNRNWGHPELVKFLERFAPLAAKTTGWHGILVGDMAQPRGGPLPFGHKSHQVGLDVDIWFTPMPSHVLDKEERNRMPPLVLVAADGKHVDPKTWSPTDAAFIRTAAEQPEVERVLVNAAIKKELCHMQGKEHPAWMAKVRPWYGHADHMHVRLKCPAGSPHCRHQPAVPGDDGCSAAALDYWFSDKVLHPRPKPGAKPPRPVMLADLPAACKAVLDAPARPPVQASER